MTDSSKTISDDFSNSSDNAPDDVYAPTSNKKPIAHPDPLQRREAPAVSPLPLPHDFGERLLDGSAAGIWTERTGTVFCGS